MGTNSVDAQRHSAEMADQRSTELAGDEARYRLRKACTVRAVELYDMLSIAHLALGSDADNFPAIEQLLKEIANYAE